MSGRCILACWMLTGVLAAPVVAEVRVVERGTETTLEVKAPSGRIWTPLGSEDSRAINPTGDLLGDGYPGGADARGRTVAAWASPSHANIQMFSTGRGVTSLGSVPARDVVGTPIVVSSAGGWIIIWLEDAIRLRVRAVAWDAVGRPGVPWDVVEGEHLLAAGITAGTLHVITSVDVASTLRVISMPVFQSDHFPYPIPSVLSSVSLDLPFGSNLGRLVFEATANCGRVFWRSAAGLWCVVKLDERGVAGGTEITRGKPGLPICD